MTTKDIERFYNQYKNSKSAIQKMEHRLLRESYSYEKWKDYLTNKSSSTRHLFEENEKGIHDVIDELKRNYGGLTPEEAAEKIPQDIAEMFLTHVDFFLDEGFRDYEVTVSVLDVIIPYFQGVNDKDRLFDCYYFRAIQIMEMYEFEEVDRYFDMALEIFDSPKKTKAIYRKARVLYLYYFRLFIRVFAQDIKSQDVEKKWKDAMEVWTAPEVAEIFTKKKQDGMVVILKALAAAKLNINLMLGKNENVFLFDIVKEEFLQQKEQVQNEIKVDSRVYLAYYKYLYCNGLLDEKEYQKKIYDKYEEEKNKNIMCMDYGLTDVAALFDEETTDDAFAVEKISYMNPSYTYIYHILSEMMSISQEPRQQMELFNELQRYYTGSPVIYGDFMQDYCIILLMENVFGNIEDEQFVQDAVAEMFINRQVTTVIHSKMVSKLAGTIASYLILENPDAFVGVCGTKSPEEVLKKKREIIGFVEMAGSCHDIGKILCTDIINLQTRKIVDDEFKQIKKHTIVGYQVADAIPAFKKYKNIILHHHLGYDRKSGYPLLEDVQRGDTDIVTDIITICDCLDAATDALGRNYSKAKKFEKLMDEFLSASGTRYSDIIVSLLQENKELYEKLRNMVEEEREKTYFEIYHNYVEPDMKFREKNEKFMRRTRESDIKKIAALTQSSVKEQREIYHRCEEKSYILLDGYGNVYGTICGHEIEKKVLYIEEIFVEEHNRRNGFGSMLLELIITEAKREGYQFLRIKTNRVGHFDKFGWRNGFITMDNTDIMEKRI